MTIAKPVSTISSAALLVLLVSSFIVRIINLNYNSAFNDEAIYVVVGRLGVFQGDWLTYNAQSWMAGLPYVYPSMTALAHVFGGVIGSRLLNVIMGVFCVKALYDIIVEYKKANGKSDYTGAFIAGMLLSLSTVALNVSRLATYDMPSFFFMFLSIFFLFKAENNEQYKGRNYFISSLLLLLSYFSKITTMFYIPLIVIYGFYRAYRKGKDQRQFWIIYFIVPLAIGFGLYALTMIPAFETFVHNQAAPESTTQLDVWNVYWENSRFLIYVSAVGVFGLLVTKQFKLLALLSIAAAWILIVHLATHRSRTFDKHIFLSLGFMSMLAGLGISSLIKLFKFSILKNIAYVATAVMILVFGYFSYKDLDRYNNAWPNANNMLAYLEHNTQPGDRILTEEGAASILAVYDKNYPFNMTTFDFFEYGDEASGDKAYTRAVRDGYFDYIELEEHDESWSELRDQVTQNMGDNYTQVYSKDGFIIYKRAF
jgi:hypothetical protein